MVCDRCKKDYAHLTYPHCNHPKVLEYYGGYICAHCCKKCSYGKDRIDCAYNLELKQKTPSKKIKKSKIKEVIINDIEQIGLDSL